MKFLLVLLIGVFSTSLFADVYIKGHYRKNGTYVAPHYKSNPNGYKHDNWSTKGNRNPYAGEYGTQDAYEY
ncbi:hypothetical protein ACMF3Y_001360 [Campylobacter coli]